MTEDEIKIANMFLELERIKECCLCNAPTYRLCVLLEEFIQYTILNNKQK